MASSDCYWLTRHYFEKNSEVLWAQTVPVLWLQSRKRYHVFHVFNINAPGLQFWIMLGVVLQ